MVSEKIINPILIIDWYSGKFRVVKKISRKLKSSEIPVNINIKLSIPEPVELKCEGNIEVPLIKAKEMIIERL